VQEVELEMEMELVMEPEVEQGEKINNLLHHTSPQSTVPSQPQPIVPVLIYLVYL
jgi:hypothetical protein